MQILTLFVNHHDLQSPQADKITIFYKKKKCYNIIMINGVDSE